MATPTGTTTAPAVATHVLLVTFDTQGHVNPFLRLAKRLAKHGLLVTFSSTTRLAHRIRSAANNPSAAASDPTPIGRGHLRFEFFSEGWDFDDPRRYDLSQYMPHLRTEGSKALSELIHRQPSLGLPPVACVIGNPFIPWVLDVAEEMGVPCGVLWCQSAAVFSAYYHYHHGLVEFPSNERPDIHVRLPGMLDLRPRELPSFLLPDNAYPGLTAAILSQIETLGKARWVLVNSTDELEKDVIAAVSSVIRLIPVGPLVDLPDEPTAKTTSTIKGDLTEAVDECLEWLDKHEANTVVYVSVGSVVRMSKGEMSEIAWGLAATRRPFLWVVRKEDRHLVPEGFTVAAGEQGMVVGWCPQERVLSHPAVGCFLTHCGWNSTVECLAHGVPAVAFPYWGDQPTDAKFLADIWKTGVRLRESMAGAFGREDVLRAVGEAMEGERAEEVRGSAAMWKEALRAALVEGGSSDRNVREFVEEVARQGSSGGGGEVTSGIDSSLACDRRSVHATSDDIMSDVS